MAPTSTSLAVALGRVISIISPILMPYNSIVVYCFGFHFDLGKYFDRLVCCWVSISIGVIRGQWWSQIFNLFAKKLSEKDFRFWDQLEM